MSKEGAEHMDCQRAQVECQSRVASGDMPLALPLPSQPTTWGPMSCRPQGESPQLSQSSAVLSQV